MGCGEQSSPTPDAIEFGTLEGSRAPRDGLRRAKLAYARRDMVCLSRSRAVPTEKGALLKGSGPLVFDGELTLT